MTRLLDNDLEEVRDLVLRMGGLAEAILTKAFRALAERDAERSAEVQADDLEIDRLDLSIDERILTLLATKAPVAQDLRFVLAVKSVATDLERVGDLARNIAKSGLRLSNRPKVVLPAQLDQLATASTRLLRRALDGFAAGDADAARSVMSEDDDIDEVEDSVVRDALREIITNPDVTEQEVDLILVAKHLERVADHATNIAEQTVLVAEAKNLKHHEKL